MSGAGMGICRDCRGRNEAPMEAVRAEQRMRGEQEAVLAAERTMGRAQSVQGPTDTCAPLCALTRSGVCHTGQPAWEVAVDRGRAVVVLLRALC